jgi:hypothetical protein
MNQIVTVVNSAIAVPSAAESRLPRPPNHASRKAEYIYFAPNQLFLN